MPGELRADLALRPAPFNNNNNNPSSSNRNIGVGINGSRPNGTPIGIPSASRQNGAPTGVPIRNSPSTNGVPIGIPIRNGNHSHHKHARSSYSDASPLVSRTNSLTFRPAKRSMPAPGKTIAVINASGRQAASLIRYATAVGYHVRAQMRNRLGVIATEVATNENVTVIEGELYTRLPRSDSDKARGVSLADDVDVTADGSSLSGIGINHDLINDLFRGAQLAFINTTFYGDELKIGNAIADAAKKANVQHFVYSSMPDHSHYDKSWPSLPLWSAKHLVEDYIYSIGLPSTFVYTGIYNNNFTSLKYPLFCMDLQPDGSFLWEAPFHPDAKLPWLDAEHDVGPAILQIFKDGVSKWGKGQRIALAYEMLSPRQACDIFSRGVGRPVRYKRGPININVPVPEGYRAQLVALEKLFMLGGNDAKKQPPYFGDCKLDADVPSGALGLWEGPRGLEEYAREVFPLEEHANGLTWMLEEDDEEPLEDELVGERVDGSALAQSYSSNSNFNGNGNAGSDDEDEDEDEDGLVMRVTARDDEEWLP
ncbi:nitrogen metabolite repression- -responsible protein [Ophiostoma piceae UAMH 11346]|uniref:Nitrogen metabolite repression--responsible protein n=1 Tax=Ophiostoma piceae (strain UAMH 11346) TaxID=1262450 RepID=S3C996_OPHP1|nr:nitrogen metabolite repression- -responsible protein [Ophiostoma piceae UAMH 11346]